MPKSKKIRFTQNRLKELFDYKNGGLYWKKKTSNRSRIELGDHAGYLRKSGYRDININGKDYLEHRLVYKWHYGYCPTQLDHINRIKDDNRIENLRGATQSQNFMNQGISANKTVSSSSKYKGVCWHKRKKKWSAEIMKNSKHYHIGYFNTEEKAAEAYNKAAIKLFEEFANLNIIKKVNLIDIT